MRKLRNWEKTICRSASLVLACSETDRQLLKDLAPGTPIAVVPNVVNINSYSPDERDDAATILFQGGMDWFPNRDAVSFFATAILPLLRKRTSGIRFIVAGRNPSPSFMSRFAGMSDVEFTATIPDMRTEIVKAAVCVVPLRIGSGTRLKILEAAAMAKAVVSTRVGAEGLDFVNGEEIILADDPDKFSGAIADLLNDLERRRAIGLAARRRVESQYGNTALRHALGQALAQLRMEQQNTQLEPELARVQAEVRP
jgi:glycosyltransferase involved in cell wall biosynthesis